jgi:hypothetical protein
MQAGANIFDIGFGNPHVSSEPLVFGFAKGTFGAADENGSAAKSFTIDFNAG